MVPSSPLVHVLLFNMVTLGNCQIIQNSTFSDFPSIIPSDGPSSVPSIRPTQGPTISPSPTVAISFPPTYSKSEFPSNSPTWIPSNRPSFQPSTVPSSAPSSECHDVRSYRSSINGLLCEDHIGTDCMKWRFLGLNTTNVEQLIISCPESCQIPCGALLRFATEYTFQLENIDTFIGPTTTKIFEDTAVEYLSNRIQVTTSNERVFISNAQLVKQEILHENTVLRRYLQPSSVIEADQLLVKMSFEGLAVGMTSEEFQNALVASVLSLGFTRAVQRSGDTVLTDAMVAEYFEETSFSGPVDEVVDESEGTSPGVIAASVLASLALLGIVVGYVMVTQKPQSQVTDSVRDIDGSILNSPAESVRSYLESIFSFDSGTTRQTRFGLGASGIKSIKSGECASSATHSRQSESSSNVSESSVDSPEYEEKIIQNHPLTGIIPPMIIVDLVDGQEIVSSESPAQGTSLVPFHRFSAPPELVEEFQHGPYEDLVDSFREADEHFAQLRESSGELRSTSFRVFSSDDESQSTSGLPALRKSLSEGASNLHESLGLQHQGERPTFVAGEVSPGKQKGASSAIASRCVSESTRVDKAEIQIAVSDSHGKKSTSSLLGASDKGSATLSHLKTSRKALSIFHSRSSSRGSSSSEPLDRQDHQTRSFSVSNMGKLGFVLECGGQACPRVLQVKDYSPLLGKVLPGDQIIGVDGVSTEKLSLREVTSLLTLGGSPRSTDSRLLQIHVSRPTGFATYPS